ncbi:hypothetical protein EON65_03670, partial [archaeon]
MSTFSTISTISIHYSIHPLHISPGLLTDYLNVRMCFFITALLAFAGAGLVYLLLEESMYYAKAAIEGEGER